MDKDMIKEIYKEKLLYLRDLSNLINIIWRLRISGAGEEYLEAVMTLYDALKSDMQKRIEDSVEKLIAEYNQKISEANKKIKEYVDFPSKQEKEEYRKYRLMRFYARKIQNYNKKVLDEFGLMLEPKTYLEDIEGSERDRFKKDFEDKEE